MLNPPDLKPCAAVANSIASSVTRHCGVSDHVVSLVSRSRPFALTAAGDKQQRDDAGRRIVHPLTDVRLLAFFLPAHAAGDEEAIAQVPRPLPVDAEVLGVEVGGEEAELAGRRGGQRERRPQQRLIDGAHGGMTAVRVAEERGGMVGLAALVFVRVVKRAGEPRHRLVAAEERRTSCCSDSLSCLSWKRSSGAIICATSSIVPLNSKWSHDVIVLSVTPLSKEYLPSSVASFARDRS